MKHIVNFSGGLCSFWAAHRVIARHGTKDVVLLVEDKSLYAFNTAASEILGVAITRICVGLSPWELFRQEGMIGNSRFPVCSHLLKREPLDEWHRRNALEIDSILYIGFDWTEEDRLNKLRRAKPGWNIQAPMTLPPLWDKCKMIAEAAKLGLPNQRLYELGFPHNNCGGACVAAGISHFIKLHSDLPEVFALLEKEELDTVNTLIGRGIKPLSILKDRRGGSAKPLLLRDLRRRIESGEKFPRDEWGGCGCGASIQPQAEEIPGSATVPVAAAGVPPGAESPGRRPAEAGGTPALPIQPPFPTRRGQPVCRTCFRLLNGPGRCRCLFDEEQFW